MSYTDLPIEIRFNIFKELHNIYHDNAKVIQRCWQKYINPQKTVMKLWYDFEDDDPDAWGLADWYNCEPSLITPMTCKLLKFTSKVISQKGIYYKYTHYFNWVIYSIDTSLCNYQYSDGYHEAAIYDEIEQYLDTIAIKLNISIPEICQHFID
tara:strand:+ start:862 stop:1320 length:459 start_codon:yes stop_codon:yes gene_type:complete